jgi:hypothetical protein
MDKPAIRISPSLRDVLFTACFTAVLFLLVPYHEVWRDEMHDLSMVMTWKSFPDLLKNTASHGFPAIWYLVLWTGYHLTKSVLILKLASIVFVSAGVFFFLRFSPFSKIEKFLFVLGYFPLYEYSLISRSYCTSFLMLFMACSFYPKRFQNFMPLAAAVFLLANTNAHSLLLAVSLFACLAIQFLTERPRIQKPKNWLSGFALIGFGVFLAVLQMWPDPTTTVKYHIITPVFLLRQLADAVINPGALFFRAFGLPGPLVNFSLWFIILASVRRQLSTGVFFFLATVSLSFLFLTVYPGNTRHQGILYLAFTALMWMEKTDRSVKMFPEQENFLIRYRDGFFLVLLLMQALMGYLAVGREMTFAHSSSADFAAFLKRDPQLREAVLVPEPDYTAEPLPFYVNNPIYFPREKRYGTYIHFTTANAANLTLNELLDAAQKIQKESGKPVLIMLGHPVSLHGPYKKHFSYGKTFLYSPEEFARLQKEAALISQFNGALTDENYDIYLLKETADSP